MTFKFLDRYRETCARLDMSEEKVFLVLTDSL